MYNYAWQTWVEAARKTRGHASAWGDDYIEQQIPSALLEKMNKNSHWTDDVGFWWGYRYTYATEGAKAFGTGLCALQDRQE